MKSEARSLMIRADPQFGGKIGDPNNVSDIHGNVAIPYNNFKSPQILSIDPLARVQYPLAVVVPGSSWVSPASWIIEAGSFIRRAIWYLVVMCQGLELLIRLSFAQFVSNR